jgi:uncharacterized protein (DUF1800 family)
MATFDAQISSWSTADVQHFGRRAGFGLTPEAATALAGQSPGAVIDAWVDDTLDKSAFNAALPIADTVATGASGNVPADPAPHPFRLDGWRRGAGIPNAQAHFAWRMQYNPNPLQEKLALFWHQLFATGAEKVNNPAFTTKQIDLFRSATGRGPFGTLLLAVSKDPAMMIWLDTVLNRVRPGSSDVPNENYAREILELYSLGVDNGYNQQDITNLAKAFSGWSLNLLDLREDPNNAGVMVPNDASFRLVTGQHATGTISFLGQSFDIGAPTRFGEDLVQAIIGLRGPNCAQFLASRLLRFFIDPALPAGPLADLQSLIQAQSFDLGRVLKAIFKSQYFYAAGNRYNLYEGPVAWTVRAARMLCQPLAAAAAVTPVPGFPRWKLVVSPYFGQAGQALLDPEGPNGWSEHGGWINSNTMRYRGKLAAALALGETSGGSMLFPSTVSTWFPTAPTTALGVFDRMTALLQPAPIPISVRDQWLSGLWTTFTWDNSAATQQKVRELAFLILCSPYAQLH